MSPFTARLRFLIPRSRLPHTEEESPHILRLGSGQPAELHIRPGAGARPDNLVLITRTIPTKDEAIGEAAAAKAALMRAGLISNVPMLFGSNTTSAGLAPALIERLREVAGATPRPDVHGVDIIDEADGATFALRIEAEGTVGTPIEKFLDDVADSFAAWHPGLALDDRVGLAIEVFMSASTERTPRARFLDFVTVLEVLAEDRLNSPEVLEVVDAALGFLAERRDRMDDEDVQSLRGSLSRLRNRSISRSVRDLADGLDPSVIEGYAGGDVRAFLRACYSVRSQLVHEGATHTSELGQLAGNLFFLLRHILIIRVEQGP